MLGLRGVPSIRALYNHDNASRDDVDVKDESNREVLGSEQGAIMKATA